MKISEKLTLSVHEINFSYSRSSGPGGQNVNKVNSKVTIRWSINDSKSIPAMVRERFQKRYPRRINDSGEVVISSQRFRDQGRNVADCLDKLSELLRTVEKPPTPRRKTKPTAGSKHRRRDAKKAQSEKKDRRRRVDY